MEWSFSARNVSLSFVCALLVTLGGGLSVLTPYHQAYASGITITPPEIVFDNPPTHDEATGTMAGEAGTDGGASSYRIPIVVPPGRAGMQPSLSLSYSSRGGNGIAGLGWSLSGLSSVHRCPQTPEQDGATRGVSYTSDDRLCLDGQRLVKVSAGGSYGDSGTIYKTEIDSYARITQLGGNLRSNSTSFKVEQKNGQILSYGATADSKVSPNLVAPLSWLVSKIEDRVGNYESFAYYTSFGNAENLLKSVTYTGSTSSPGNRIVQFTYQTRGAQDISSSALAGGLTMQTQALAAIRTGIDGVIVRKYTPSYAESKYSKRLLMTAMTECAGESSPCHPPTQFTYNDDYMDPALAATPTFELKSLEGLGLPSPTPLSGEVNENYHIRVAGDYDGDGTRETVVSATTGGATHVYLTQFTADRKAHSPVEIAAPYNQLISAQTSEADMDGSGRSALIGLQLDPTYVAFGLWDYNLFQRGTPVTGNPFGKVSTNIRLPESFGVAHGQSKLVLAADVDGNGKTDIVTIQPEPSCGPRDSFGFQDAVFLHKSNIGSPFAIGQIVTFDSPVKLFCLNRIAGRIGFAEESIDHIGDFNGDGLADFYLVYGGAGSSLVGGIAGIRITQPGAATALMSTCSQIGLVSNGTAIDDCSGDQNYAVHWMDVNADGLEDFVIARPSEAKWKLRLNIGNGVFGAELDTNSALGLVTDETGSVTGPKSRFRYANSLPSMDVDGDGKADLLIPSQKPGIQAFAVKMCTIKRVRRIVGADVPVCPSALGGVIPQSPDSDAVTSGEICAAYSCPPNPDGSAPLPSNFTTHGENEGYPYKWNNLPAFSAYNSHVNHDGPGEDNSAYHLAQLKFVQTGTASFSVSSVETALVSKLNDYSGRSDDLFGDGLPDLMTSIGCSNLIIHQAGSDTDAEWNEQKCSAVTSVNGIAYGPTTLPDNVTTTTSLATKVVLFANINQGIAAPGGSMDGATFQASQRPTAPALTASTGGMSLNLPVPNLPGLMDGVINGVGDFAIWGYYPLSVRASYGSNLPFYTVLPDESKNPSGYADGRHYYFQSSMPTVYGMAQNNGVGGASGFRSATYAYREAMYHHLGRGFQGFRAITSTVDGLSNRVLRTNTTFHQKFPLTGRIESVETTLLNRWRDRLLKREADTWICQISDRAACLQGDDLPQPAFNPNGGTVYAPLLDTQRIDSFDIASGAAVSHTETINALTPSGGMSGWDINGNLVDQMVRSGDDGGGSFVKEHKVVTHNDYVPAIFSSWWLDQLNNSRTDTSIDYVSGQELPNNGGDPAGHSVTTSYIWNSSDRTPLSQTVSASGKTLTTTYGYSNTTARGLPQSVKIDGTGIVDSFGNPAPRTTQFSYTKDGTGQATQQDGYFVLTTINALLQSSTTEHSTRDGQVTRVIDPNNLKTLNTYDAFGRLTGMTFADASNLELLKPVSIGYCRASSCGSGYGEGDNQSNAAWRVTRVQEGAPTSSDWFDVLGRTIKHVERGFNDYFVETTTDYDAMGTVALQSTPFLKDQTPPQLPYFTAWNYDALNRPIEKNAPGSELDSGNGNVKTTYSYSGNKTTIKVRATGVSANCSGLTNLCMDMSRSYDVLGRLGQTVQNSGSTSNYATTDYWYDGLGNSVAARDAGNSVMTAIYNDLGQRTDLFDPDAGHWQSTYNALGEVIDQTDARLVTTHHDYDALGRLTQRTAINNASSDGSLKVIRDTWNYDPPGGAGLLNYAFRQRGSSVSGLAEIWQESNVYYPDTKRLKTQSSKLEGQASAWVTSFTYDSYGRPFTTAYPNSGLTVRKGYTSNGELRQLSNDVTGSIYWTGNTKDAWGNLTSETWAGGITGAHSTYASTGQIKQKQWTQNASLLNQLDYSYDSFGNLTSQSSVLNGVTAGESYAYDGLQRLTQTTRSGVSSNPAPVIYRYQNNGNLSAKSDYSFGTQGSYVYGGGSCGPHAVRAVVRAGSSLTYECDANGNVIGGSALNATYDFNNQPWTINRLNDGSGSALFAYSSNGDVFKTVAGGKSTWFGAAGYEETSILGAVTKRHELGPVTVLRQNGVDTVNAVLRDRLGSQVMSLGVTGGTSPGVPTLSSTNNPSMDGNYTIKWSQVSGTTQYQLFESANGDQEVKVYQGTLLKWSPAAARSMGRYVYRIKSCKPACGDFSAAFSENVAPPAPTGVSANPNPSTTGSFRIAWYAINGVQSYSVEEKQPEATTFNVVATDVTSAYWDATGKTAGTWQYRIRACLSACGNPSATVTESVTIPGGDTEASPATHFDPAGDIQSTGTFTMSWTTSSTAENYLLEEILNGGSPSYTGIPAPTTTTTITRGDGLYQYKVKACRTTQQVHCSIFSAPLMVRVTGSATPVAPEPINSSVPQGTCVPFNTANPPTPPNSYYTISWQEVLGAQKYVVRESNTAFGTPIEYETTSLFRKFDHQKNELPIPREPYTKYSYEAKACTGSGAGELCSLWTSPVSTCVGVDDHSRPEATTVSTAYDAFGKVRNGDYSDRLGGKLNLLPDTLRGFTGHQHVDDVRLIHMNGRVYDYELGRFLSADPVIGNPKSTQSINPYSYIGNNPLSGTDPTGYCSTGSHIDQGDSAESCQDMGVTVDGSQPSTKAEQAIGMVTKSINAFASKWNSMIAQRNGADAMGSSGPSSATINGMASDIGAMASSIGKLTSATGTAAARDIFPEAAKLSDQGGGGEVSAGGVVIGSYNTAARVANEAISLAAFLGNSIHNVDFVNYKSLDIFPVFQAPPELQKSVAIGELIFAGASVLAAPERVGADAASVGFSSFRAFKRAFGRAGENMDWHHIVEKTPINIAQFGNEVIHNSENLVSIPRSIHNQISGFYSRKLPGSSERVRDMLGREPWEVQYNYGLDTLRRAREGNL